MSRSFAKVFRDVWSDEEFLDLEPGPQRAYLFLVSQPNLNAAGVVSVTLRRWASRAKGYTMEALTADLDVLAARRFIVLDEATEELLVRTYIRNDGLWRIPNTLYAVVRDAQATASPVLREALADELEKLPVAELTGKRADEMRRQVATVIATLRATVKRTLGTRVSATARQLLAQPKGQPEGAGVGVGVVVQVVDPSVVQNGTAPPSAPPRSRTTEREDPPRADVERLCQRLSERMAANGVLRRDTKITQGWRDEARRLLDRDGVPLAEALAVLDWCQGHSFWKTNVMSLGKFRKQYSGLRAKAQQDGALRSLGAASYYDTVIEDTESWDNV